MILRLHNPIRDYAWGSRTALAEFQGRPSPSAGPEAELWMGAQPSGPSSVEIAGRAITLEAWIASDPEAILGAEIAHEWGGALPFLLKVLAPAQALSIQTHPDAEQAREGFGREEERGVARDDPRRSYRDPNPKPELICALEPFDALCGFRTVDEIAELLAALGAPRLEPLRSALREGPGHDGLESLLGGLLRLPEDERVRLCDEAAEAAAGHEGEAFRWIVELARQHPGDPGVVAPLLLNLVRLEPGTALFLEAGEPHAYLRGLGVELMANSDNVLRGGLTSKHVDVPEFLATLTWRTGRPEVLSPHPSGAGVTCFEPPVREFAMDRLDVRSSQPAEPPPSGGIEILLCAAGEIRLIEGGGETLPLVRGESAVVPASAGALRIEGTGLAYRARVPG